MYSAQKELLPLMRYPLTRTMHVRHIIFQFLQMGTRAACISNLNLSGHPIQSPLFPPSPIMIIPSFPVIAQQQVHYTHAFSSVNLLLKLTSSFFLMITQPLPGSICRPYPALYPASSHCCPFLKHSHTHSQKTQATLPSLLNAWIPFPAKNSSWRPLRRRQPRPRSPRGAAG